MSVDITAKCELKMCFPKYYKNVMDVMSNLENTPDLLLGGGVGCHRQNQSKTN